MRLDPHVVASNTAAAPHTVACRMVACDALAGDVVGLRLQVPPGGFAYLAGQYVRLTLHPRDGATVERPYSIATPPSAFARDGLLTFHVRMSPGGSIARAMAAGAFDVGARVDVSGPFGDNALHGASPHPMLLLAGGTGLGAMLSIAEEAVALGTTPPIALYIGARHEADLFDHARWQGLLERAPNVRVTAVVSHAAPSSPLRRGLITDAVAHDVPDASAFDCYLAGPPAMIDAAVPLLLRRGAASARIYVDHFDVEAARRRLVDES